MRTSPKKYPKCPTCVYSYIGPSGTPLCGLYACKRVKCKAYHRPDTERFEFDYEGYRLVVAQVNYFSIELKAELYAVWLNVYLKPYSAGKKINPVYIAHGKGMPLKRDKETLKRISIESFEENFLMGMAEA